MTSRMAATRYGRALFDVAIKEADPDRVASELDALARLLDEHELLRKVLVNPAIPPARKRAIVATLFTRAGDDTPPVLRKLILLLADRDRLALVPLVAEAYRQRLMEHRHIVRADVTTAAPLPVDRAQALERSLSEATGKRVSIATRLDPALIGGLVARIGSVVYDGSVRRQLQRIKEKMMEEA